MPDLVALGEGYGNSTGELSRAWLAYVRSTAVLLVAAPEDRPLDQFLQFRDKALAMAQENRFLKELDADWKTGPETSTQTADAFLREALIAELLAFTHAVEVAQKTAGTESQKTSWFSRLLGRSSTVAGSVKDVAEHLPWWAKGTIDVFKECVDLFQDK